MTITNERNDMPLLNVDSDIFTIFAQDAPGTEPPDTDSPPNYNDPPGQEPPNDPSEDPHEDPNQL